ncbi:MAG: efflux RND transporter periplasmic adaptor subunit [Myxococcota bacterium]
MNRTLFALMLVSGLWSCHRHDHDHDHHGGHDDEHSHSGAVHGHGHGHDDDGPAPESRTSWGAATQSFSEFPPLVLGVPVKFASHLTWAHDWSPVAKGTLTVVLSGGDAPEERFAIKAVSQPGIFRPEVTPGYPVTRRLSLELSANGAIDRHELGEVSVLVSEAQLPKAEEDEEGSTLVTLLLEQQWNLDFRVEKVSSRRMREGFAVYGRVRELNDSVTTIKSPVGGRLMSTNGALPAPGATIRRDDVLASVLPMVDPAGNDRAGLERSRDEARAKERWAKGEVERLEGLVSQGAASARSLSEAQLTIEEARVGRRAAQRRLAQLSAVQSVNGAEASAIEVRAPYDGRVRQVHVRAGAYVSADEALLELVDPAGRIFELDVPEVEASKLHQITGARVQLDGQTEGIELPLEARIDAPLGVDDVRHTIPLWWRLGGAPKDLPAGLAVRAQLWTGDSVEQVAVPRSAIVQDAGVSVVYVQVDGENFRRRPVKTGARDGEHVAITEGLLATESVAVEGAYLLKLASLKDAAPAQGHTH